MSEHKKEIPVIDVGQYAGTPIDQLPIPYLRWMLGQDFPPEWLEIARERVGGHFPLSVSRHAIDRFSLRFLEKWQEYQQTFHGKHGYQSKIGLATFLVKQAESAWKYGKDVTKPRHKKKGIVKQYEGIRYVFVESNNAPGYRELVTVMK